MIKKTFTGVCRAADENGPAVAAIADPAVHEIEVVERFEPAPDVILLRFHAPELAAVTRPGQFLMAIPPSGERTATALGIYESGGNRISLLFFVCGARTRELGELRKQDKLAVTGPLGNGFDYSGVRDAAIVAGGVGVASVLLLAEELVRSGSRVRFFYGARSAQHLVERDRFGSLGCEVHCATDDGSFGRKGFVTELLAELDRKPDRIFACGPSPMLRATAVVASELDVPAQLALEETFACGVGACWGCVAALDRNSKQAPHFPDAQHGGADVVYARICKEGPVFWAHELRW